MKIKHLIKVASQMVRKNKKLAYISLPLGKYHENIKLKTNCILLSEEKKDES